MLSTAIFVYAATSPVNGYFGGSLYAKQGGDYKLILFSSLNPKLIVNCVFSDQQAEDGLSKCSLGPFWSQPWSVGLLSLSTSLRSITTPQEPSHLAPWLDLTQTVSWNETDVDGKLHWCLCFLQVAVCCICFFVILPLNLVGTILGRNLSGQPNFPCRVNAVPRPIPEKKWWVFWVLNCWINR